MRGGEAVACSVIKGKVSGRLPAAARRPESPLSLAAGSAEHAAVVRAMCGRPGDFSASTWIAPPNHANAAIISSRRAA